jgi:hypothetical protein
MDRLLSISKEQLIVNCYGAGDRSSFQVKWKATVKLLHCNALTHHFHHLLISGLFGCFFLLFRPIPSSFSFCADELDDFSSSGGLTDFSLLNKRA